MTRNNVLNR